MVNKRRNQGTTIRESSRKPDRCCFGFRFLCNGFLILVLVILLSSPVSAYTFLVVDETDDGPAAYRWDPQEKVEYLVDAGNLSPSINNADGVNLIQSAFDRWENGTWNGRKVMDLDISYAGLTNIEITRNNFELFEGQSVIIFDRDGSIIDALLGGGSFVLGFAEVTNVDDGEGTITAARAFFNGTTADRADLGDFEATVVHELGHFLGLGHTYVAQELLNGNPSDDGPIPTMYPTSLDDDTHMRTPELDDLAGMGDLYGSTEFQMELGILAGNASWPEDLPVLGGHVEARNLSETGIRIGVITGYLQDGTGSYRMVGVPPGDYKVTLEAIPFSFEGASVIGQYDPPLRDLFPTLTHKTPSDTSDFTTVTVSADKVSTVDFVIPEENSGFTVDRFSRLSPISLDDDEVTTDTLMVPREIMISDFKVFVDIVHTYIGDLKISLTSPSGRTVLLVSQVGFSGNLIETTFTREKVPALSGFIDEGAEGTWTLVVADTAPEDVGTLRRWWITILSEGATTLQSDFNSDGEVDLDDFFLFAAVFGTETGEAGFDPKFDLSVNGKIDFDDFFMFAANFGKKV